MNVFLALAFLFFIGSIGGWVLELFYRKTISKGKWINPGFLVGPYLPLYGFGLCTFYMFSHIQLPGPLVILIMTAIVTLIEYIAGIIFIKGMGVKLWDYSNNWGNINGLICPLYILIWGILGTIYYYLVNPSIIGVVEWLGNNLAFSFVIGFFFGIITIDLVYSTQIIVKIRKFAKEKDLIVKYEEFKTSIFDYAEKNKEKYSFVFAISNNVKKIEEYLNEYKRIQKQRANEIKKTVNGFIEQKVKPKTKKKNLN